MTDGVSGWLVRERDVTALAERLSRLIQEPEACAIMGRAGRAAVEEQYDIEKLNDTLSNMLRDVVSSGVDCRPG